jgi:uncharacterized iron-regulated protein
MIPSSVRLLILAFGLALSLAALSRATGALPAPYPWEDRLKGDAIVLLGEVHDNPMQHRLRLEVLQRAFAAGWRPALAMEQFDREHQADIERARNERPLDASYLIEQAAPMHGKPGSGWNWEYYRPYVALALEYHVPLLAANLSRSDAETIVEHGYSAVFEAATLQSLGLDRERPQLLAAQQKEIDIGHCHAMPKEQLPAMARAQMARDAAMATILREHAVQGVVLLAGDGHVRRDIGVPTWFDPPLATRVFAVGFLERGERRPPDSAFDAVVITDATPRPDPCAALRPGSTHRKPVMTR